MEHSGSAQACPQDASVDAVGDVNITKSQDAVIAEISEQYVEEASTAEVGKRSAATAESVQGASVDPASVQIAVGGIGDVPGIVHQELPLERFNSLSQRDGYESREASNGTGLYGYDEKEEPGPTAETIYRTEDALEVSKCEEKNNSSDALQMEEVSNEARSKVEQRPALSGNVDVQKPPLPEEARSLSKSDQKVLGRQERYKQTKLQKRAQDKAMRHQETEKKRREWQEKLANLSEDEVQKAKEERMGLRASRKDERKVRKDKLIQVMADGQNIVIDLEFVENMKPNEISSLCQQVVHSYAANGRAEVPCRLSLTSCTSTVREQLKMHYGFESWLLHKEYKSYIDVFEGRKEDLVYLTADSETVLETVDKTKIYIVGGLVDHDRWDGIAAEKAKNQGISTAKLPIDKHMLSSQVLTVDQVVDILLQFMNIGDWEKAVSTAIPPRKRVASDPLEGASKQTKCDSDQMSSKRGDSAMDAMSEVGDEPMANELAREMSIVDSASQSASFSESSVDGLKS
ncbi:uncharacterized protein [Physcomitrium patens]|nr:tRNA (guanine(9)-N1)-methyltransferase-like isoform X1 [Physcomitrium patens]|eukprot:XP_024366712.1 tRNA (guanine(9)-N1)-methyltransferase-like isoform X1 [Physcomitrella patens]